LEDDEETIMKSLQIKNDERYAQMAFYRRHGGTNSKSGHFARLMKTNRKMDGKTEELATLDKDMDFKDMMEMHVAPAMATQTSRIMESVEKLEARWPNHVDAVNDAQTELQDHLVKSWWQLADDLVAHFSDGVYHYKNTTVKQMGYPAWWLQMIGFTNDFFRVQWVQFSFSPPAMLLSSLPWSLRTSASSNFLASTLGGAAAEVSGFVPGLLCGMMIGGGVVGLLLQRTSRQSGLSARLLVQ